MTYRIPPVISTLLSNVEPLSAEELKLTDKKRKALRSEMLESLLTEAFRDTDFANDLCERVGNFARGTEGLTTTLKKSMVRNGPGRSIKWSTPAYWHLLLHYAHIHINEANGDHSETISKLKVFVSRVYGVEMTPEGVDNKISLAIKNNESAGQLDTLPAWAREVIEKRQAKGNKCKRRPSSKAK